MKETKTNSGKHSRRVADNPPAKQALLKERTFQFQRAPGNIQKGIRNTWIRFKENSRLTHIDALLNALRNTALPALCATQIVGPSKIGATSTGNRGGKTLALAAANHPA
jgi:hypothetical protein